MFLILKAELSYIRFNLLNAFLMVLVFLLIALIRGFNPTNLICFILMFQFLSFTYFIQLKERRNLLYTLLYLSIKRIATYRIILSLVGFIPIYSLGMTTYLIFDFPHEEFHDTLLELLLFGGMTLMAYYTYLFISDFFSVFKSKSEFQIFNRIVGVVILLAIILTALSVEVSYGDSLEDGIRSVIFIYIGVVTFGAISYVTYQHRESHLGYL